MPTKLTLQEFLDRLMALPESARSLHVTWRSPATGACYTVESTVDLAVETMRERSGRGSKATTTEETYVVIQ